MNICRFCKGKTRSKYNVCGDCIRDFKKLNLDSEEMDAIRLTKVETDS